MLGADIADPTAASVVATDALAVAPAPAASWFADWANQQGIQEFARLIEHAGLTAFIESCETPLTIFVPTNEAIRAMAGTMPTDMQLLRELLCVHITMGSLRWAPSVRARASPARAAVRVRGRAPRLHPHCAPARLAAVRSFTRTGASPPSASRRTTCRRRRRASTSRCRWAR